MAWCRLLNELFVTNEQDVCRQACHGVAEPNDTGGAR